ncbi:WXG100 family type VII secretion target [Rhodococcus sp. SGAir0479]|uniref:WXG100 family type VII secretion target n=1 Tax=Rhodococcus sp. SGAir0479 TaxID=2567884 RepID=UPI0010CCF276|nr:WXG100 family type VII secretion target [Rhodococcus sp. SGAir0479]QCQ92150.1 WXG100 family type VII secretion target [Rhodococcus sp. SGAir0479]
MSDQMRTTVETMEATSRRVSDVRTEIQGLLSTLKGEVDGIRGGWEGSAAIAFHSLMERWDASANKLGQALDAISENIKSNSVSYDTAQQDHTSSLTNVASSLNI